MRAVPAGNPSLSQHKEAWLAHGTCIAQGTLPGAPQLTVDEIAQCPANSPSGTRAR